MEAVLFASVSELSKDKAKENARSENMTTFALSVAAETGGVATSDFVYSIDKQLMSSNVRYWP